LNRENWLGVSDSGTSPNPGVFRKEKLDCWDGTIHLASAPVPPSFIEADPHRGGNQTLVREQYGGGSGTQFVSLEEN